MILISCKLSYTARDALQRLKHFRRIRDSSYWLFFLDRTTFLGNLQDPNRRRLMHPSLVLSALAMANLMQSSDLERGAPGRMRALELRDKAQAMLDATCSAARLDPSRLDFTLAEAALVN